MDARARPRGATEDRGTLRRRAVRAPRQVPHGPGAAEEALDPRPPVRKHAAVPGPAGGESEAAAAGDCYVDCVV